MADIIQHRRDTASNWTTNNPTLAEGEVGYETDTGYQKLGDGSSTWTSLSYIGTGPTGPAGPTGDSGLDGADITYGYGTSLPSVDSGQEGDLFFVIV